MDLVGETGGNPGVGKKEDLGGGVGRNLGVCKVGILEVE